jgi:hypothetical protein
MSRLFGGRDVALGLALAIADKTNPKLRRDLLLIGAACDTWDATCAVRARDGLPRWGKAPDRPPAQTADRLIKLITHGSGPAAHPILPPERARAAQSACAAA